MRSTIICSPPHMIQHFMLMSVAPPLLVVGAPVVPMLRGLPRPLVRTILRPLLRARWFHGFTRIVTHPATAWLAMNATYLRWHVPAAFELTFRSEIIHDFEHMCFFATSLGFWWVVLAPWPASARWPRWTVIPYLLTADVVNTIVSATLAFSGRVLYPCYAQAERTITN
jgi:putative membrane protein